MTTILRVPLRAAFVALLSLSPLVAQSLSGRVTSPTGLPIPGIEVDVGGGNPTAITDGNGLFTIAPLTNDSYDVEYLPGLTAPWAARLIVTNVTGATNVGDIVLQPGFALSGTARNGAGLPLASCNINVYSQNGTKLFTPHDATDLAGNFSVTVPAGLWDMRVLPPLLTLLVPQQIEDVLVAGATSVGLVTLPDGHQVTGTVNDSVSLVPVGATRIKITNAITNQRLYIANDLANTFGQFNLLLPTGMFDIDFEPPVGNTHTGKRKYGVVVTGPASLGQVRLQNGVLVSGTVTGPAGALAGVDIDVLDAFGTKLFSPRDVTDATGTFSLAVPAGTGYRLEFEPPVGAGLVGTRTAALTLSGPTSLGTVNLPAGAPVVGRVKGPAGVEAGAEVVFLDNTLAEIVTTGHVTSNRGTFATNLTTGFYGIEVRPAEGSYHRTARGQIAVSAGQKQVASFTLVAKTLRCTMSAIGTPAIAQGGTIAVDLLLDNRTPTAMAVTMDLVVRTTAGIELPVLLGLPLTAPTVPLPLAGLPVQIPVLAASELGKVQRLVVRFRDPNTQFVLDSATTGFVVE